MISVLDASVFMADFPIDGEIFTTPSVVGELVDFSAKCRLDVLLAAGLQVAAPTPEALGDVKKAARETGDAGVLSGTDRDILALARDLDATLVTDDFAVQNVATHMQIKTRPIRQRFAKPVRWKFRCTGCGRYYPSSGRCPVCGLEIKRKFK